ncbi:MAG: M23 family metallopeptidase [Aquabacterium sp.]|nr:MAG: M23 family metallopeptidase [Aquabacterium sp.]
MGVNRVNLAADRARRIDILRSTSKRPLANTAPDAPCEGREARIVGSPPADPRQISQHAPASPVERLADERGAGFSLQNKDRRLVSLLQSFERAARSASTAVSRHPRRLAAAVATLLAGATVAAFGVAPLAGSLEQVLPLQQTVNESIPLPQLDHQLEALDLSALQLWRSDLTRSTDTADSLLKRLGVDDPEVAAFLRRDAVARRVLEGRAGKMMQAVATDGRLVRLVARYPAEDASLRDSHFTRLTIERDALGLRARTEVAALEVQTRIGSGTIHSSLFAAADDAAIPDGVTVQMAEIFGTDIDFRRELRRGDSFTVAYEAPTADGEPVAWNQAAGRVLAARFINDGKTHEAIWFQEPGRKGAYFDSTGRSKTRMFLASPLAFSRVTSGFAMRFHPVLKTWRAHLGVDLGAPSGTPVRVVGDGTVEFAGWQNGYGNVIHIRHDNSRMTVYAHLSRIDVKRGQRVEQGQGIGAVGATGWATGPHLHFEFRKDGQQIDPMTIARASEAAALTPAALARFKEVATASRLQLQAATTSTAMNMRVE